MRASNAVTDEDRLGALDSYGILDTPPEEGFDEIVELATLICDAPVALVSFVTGDRQWFKARHDFPRRETDLDSSVCAHALSVPDLLIIEDLTTDPRTWDNPLVTGEPQIRFYAGAPLRTRQGLVLGTLCVIDKRPRPEGLTARQQDALRSLARQVMALLELRRTIDGRDSFIARRRAAEARLGENTARLRVSEAHWRGLFERMTEGVMIAELVRDAAGRAADWRHLDVNAAWSALLGVDIADATGRTAREIFPDVEDAWIGDFARVVETGEPAMFTRPVPGLDRWYEGRAFALDGERFAAVFVEVTSRVRAEIRRDALLEIGDELRQLDAVGTMTRVAAAIVGRALGVTRAGFGRLDADGADLTIEPDWTATGIPSIAGRHRFSDYGDIGRELLRGEPLVVDDTHADPRTAGATERWAAAQIRALVNIPIQERGRTVAAFIVQDTRPRRWSAETIAFLRAVADRLAAAIARVQAEERQAVLNQELSHRMKNMLAMVQAIAMQTLKDATDREAVASFQQRLQALSRAHDVLLPRSWTAAPLRAVVEAVLQASGQMDRFTIRGPSVMLGPRAALSTSLLLHELATNAVKFGALSAERGRIAVAWQIAQEAGELVFTWTEADGPNVVEPTRRGFGSRLIGSGLIGTGGVTLRYEPGGFEAEMRACLEQVQAT